MSKSKVHSRAGVMIEALEDQLSSLARQFRAAAGETERQLRIAREYEITIQALFDTGQWCGEPDVEDQLPSEFMPAVYTRFWADKLGSISHHAPPRPTPGAMADVNRIIAQDGPLDPSPDGAYGPSGR